MNHATLIEKKERAAHSATTPNNEPTLTNVSNAIKQVMLQNEQIVEEYQVFVSHVVKNAVAEATIGIPEPDSPSSSTEEKIVAQHSEAKTALEHNLWKIRSNFENKKKVEEENLRKMPSKETLMRELETDKRRAFAEADEQAKAPSFDPGLWWLIWKKKTVKGVLTALRENLRQLEEKRNHVETCYQNLLVTRYQRIHPQKSLIDHPIVFWALMAVFSVVEIAVNLTAFQNLNIGSDNMYATIFATLFAFSQSFSAKELGAAWQRGHHRHQVIYIVATLSLCLFICFLRLNIEQENWLICSAYIAINIFFVGLTVIMGYFHTRHSDFFPLLARRRKLSKKIENTRSVVEQIEESHKKRCEEIELDFENHAEAREKTRREEIEGKITEYGEGLAQLEGHEEIFKKRLKNVEESALNQYRHLNHDTRISIGHPPVKRWKNLLPDLNGSIVNSWAAISFVAMCGWGCHPSPQPHPQTHIEVLYDRTDTTHRQNTELLREYIFDLAFQDTLGQGWGETTVTFSPIGETSTQTTQIISITPSVPFWNRNEHNHRESKKHFIHDMDSALNVLMQPGTGLKQSFIHRNFYYRLSELSKHPGKKILISWSDLLANDTYANFYGFASNPHGLWSDKDELIAHMESGYPLPDLHGIKIINIHQPTKRWDELHEAAKRFWKHYWTSKGAEVEFKTNFSIHHTMTKVEAR